MNSYSNSEVLGRGVQEAPGLSGGVSMRSLHNRILREVGVTELLRELGADEKWLTKVLSLNSKMTVYRVRSRELPSNQSDISFISFTSESLMSLCRL